MTPPASPFPASLHSIDSVSCESKTLGILHHVAGKCDSEIGATVCIELKTLNDQILIP